MRDALVLVDVVQTFAHEDGDKLLEPFRSRHKGSSRRGSARGARRAGLYANVNFAVWDGGAPRLVRSAFEGRPPARSSSVPDGYTASHFCSRV